MGTDAAQKSDFPPLGECPSGFGAIRPRDCWEDFIRLWAALDDLRRKNGGIGLFPQAIAPEIESRPE
jgi:hypothetical protein